MLFFCDAYLEHLKYTITELNLKYDLEYTLNENTIWRDCFFLFRQTRMLRWIVYKCITFFSEMKIIAGWDSFYLHSHIFTLITRHISHRAHIIICLEKPISAWKLIPSYIIRSLYLLHVKMLSQTQYDIGVTLLRLVTQHSFCQI